MKSMGGVAVLHPQDSISTPKKSRGMIKFNRTYTTPPTHTPIFTSGYNVSDGQTRTPPKGTLKKNNNKNTEHMKNNRIEFFAGFGFVDSPPPSSVPLPGFFTKNLPVKNDPSNELRRILGLSLS